MNLQEVFNKVCEHLMQQGRRAEMTEDMVEAFGTGPYDCAYRGENGTKCAVGCLIEDKHYSLDLENKVAHNPDVVRALRLSGVNVLDALMQDTLVRLQGIHDARKPDEWAWALRELAEKLKLEVPDCIKEP